MKNKNSKPNYTLTIKEALELLAPHKEGRKQRVHSFQGIGPILSGCSIDLSNVKKYLKKAKNICLSGENMRGMGHGVAYIIEGQPYTFLETDKEKVEAKNKEREIL